MLEKGLAQLQNQLTISHDAAIEVAFDSSHAFVHKLDAFALMRTQDVSDDRINNHMDFDLLLVDLCQLQRAEHWRCVEHQGIGDFGIMQGTSNDDSLQSQALVGALGNVICYWHLEGTTKELLNERFMV